MGGRRIDDRRLLGDYIDGKQTLAQLAEKYGVCVKTVWNHLEHMRHVRVIPKYKDVVVNMDTTFWGRDFGLMVIKDTFRNRIVWYKFVQSETVYGYQFGGSGSATSRNLSFKVGGSGSLCMEIESGSDSEVRYMKVFVNGTEFTDNENYVVDSKSGFPAPKKGEDIGEYKIPITASAGDEIMIYSAGSGIIVLSLGWTPEPVEGGGITPDDETITEEYITDYSNEGTAAGYADVADGETLTVNKITYAGAITWDSSRYKMNGASKVGDDGIPTSRYACFKIATTGKITHKMISGSSGDAERKYDVILVKGGEVTTLYSEYAPISSGADAVVTEVTAEHLAGATEPVYIYVYVEANCNLYQIGFTPDN